MNSPHPPGIYLHILYIICETWIHDVIIGGLVEQYSCINQSINQSIISPRSSSHNQYHPINLSTQLSCGQEVKVPKALKAYKAHESLLLSTYKVQRPVKGHRHLRYAPACLPACLTDPVGDINPQMHELSLAPPSSLNFLTIVCHLFFPLFIFICLCFCSTEVTHEGNQKWLVSTPCCGPGGRNCGGWWSIYHRSSTNCKDTCTDFNPPSMGIHNLFPAYPSHTQTFWTKLSCKNPRNKNTSHVLPSWYRIRDHGDQAPGFLEKTKQNSIKYLHSLIQRLKMPPMYARWVPGHRALGWGASWFVTPRRCHLEFKFEVVLNICIRLSLKMRMKNDKEN